MLSTDMLTTNTIARRVEELDWSQISSNLDERGYAVTPRVLSEDECEGLAGLFDEEDRFRNVDEAMIAVAVTDAPGAGGKAK